MNPKDKTQLRKQAEQLLNNRQELGNITELTAKDDLQLIEEMQIYLAELEVQNQELQETQQRLDHQQTQYKNLFDQLPIPAILVNDSGIILENNAQAELLFTHRNTRHLHNHSVFRFFGKKTNQWLFNCFKDIELSKTVSAEFDSEIKDLGIPIQINLMPIKNSLDPLSERQFIVTLMDLTAQYEQQKNWQMFQGILDHSSVLIYAADRQGRFVLANQKLADLFGCRTADELQGQKREQFMSIADADSHFQHDLEVIQQQKPIQINETLLKEGKLFHYLTDKFPLFNAQHEVFAVGGITYDITEQQQQEKKLAISNEIFNKGQDGILVCDANANIISVNKAFEKITGYRADECIGKNPRMLGSGKQSPQFYENLWRSLQSSGHWRGEIWNKRKSGDIYPEQLSISVIKNTDGEIISYLSVFNDISEKKEAEEEITQLAFYDALTGVANRILLRERVNQLIANHQRSPVSFSLMFLDLDHFKEVNDVYGHDIGDGLLKQVTQRITALIRPEDTLARMGGDEFTLLVPDIHADDSIDLGERLITTLSAPYDIEGKNLTISASIGITRFPEHALDYATLLKAADLAMYHAKNSGRNGLYVFRKELATKLTETVNIETELRHAINRGEFYLMYQPQYSIRQKRFTSMEALIRWRHPQMGNIPPDKFIPIAERSDLILDITDWVIETALTDLQRLMTQNPAYATMRVAVNFSPRGFTRSDFVDRIQRHLARFPMISPNQFEIEVTERLAMRDPIKMLALFKTLRKLGVSLSLDDFGTGYSSMSYLTQYPLQLLKIDKSFVDEIGISRNGEAVCKTIILLAQSTGYQTIAEGVETAAQAEFLEAHGCDMIQGYFYSKPLTFDDLVAFLNNQKTL